MSCNWMRRALLALASTSALLLASCGGGDIVSQLQPARVIAFGDGFSDLGQGGSRYTVNDGTFNVWTQQVALFLGLGLTASSGGGASYATGNARITTKPDAAGRSTTLTVKEQIDAYLSGNTFNANDVVFINGGISDIIAETAQLTAGAQTSDQMIANVKQAGRDLGTQVKRLVSAGATHVVVLGTYDLSRSPWATAINQTALLTEASTRFNTELLVSTVDQGANVLYIDAALLFNLMSGTPTAYGLLNSIAPVCTSVDAGPGIGTGAGQVNSALCTPTTILASTDYGVYMFADRVYPTPAAHRQLASYAYQRIRARW